MGGRLGRAWIALVVVALLATACGDSVDDGAGGTSAGGSGRGASGQGAGDSFDPEQPGVHLFFTLGSVFMMGQSMELALAGFMPTAREDFEGEPAGDGIPLDTCIAVAEQSPTPSCAGDEDCAPEQECLPETDDGGNPIAGTERCVTPRELMDVGPMTVEGFATGPIEFAYNPGQSGAYTAPGSDGTLEPGTLAFDQTYSLHGVGDAGQGLGAFSGEVHLPAALELTAPPLIDLAMPGMVGIEATPGQELSLEWSGGTGSGTVRLNLAGGSEQGGSIDCRVADDGAFAIPAAMVDAAGLADMAMLNMVTLTREGDGTATGEGLTFHAVGVMQTLVINVQKVP